MTFRYQEGILLNSQLATREGILRKRKLGKGTTVTVDFPSDKGFKEDSLG